MRVSRRGFNVVIAAAGLARAAAHAPARSISRRKRILVLGGTNFVGPAVVEAALAKGYEVTLFNRGKTNPTLFPQLELLKGDRDPKHGDLSTLGDKRTWDVVADIWPAEPSISAMSARLLAARTQRYLYVSSISAYKSRADAGISESAPLFDDPSDKSRWYNFGKAETERQLSAILGPKFVAVRPSIIVGWRNPWDGLAFWSTRMERGGDVLMPGDGSNPIQFIDVRDVGRFMLRIADNNLSGAYNVVGPAQAPLNFGQFGKRLWEFTGHRSNLVWVPMDFLAERGVQMFTDLPMFIWPATAPAPGFMAISNARAVAAGMQLRALDATAADDARWFKSTRPPGYQFAEKGSDGDGLTHAHELELLAAWKRERT